MEKQRLEESEQRREEEKRSEKRKSQQKEDAGVRKGRKVAIHCDDSGPLIILHVFFSTLYMHLLQSCCVAWSCGSCGSCDMEMFDQVLYGSSSLKWHRCWYAGCWLGGVRGGGWRGALASRLDQLERLPKTASHLLYSANSQPVRCLQD